MKRILALLNKGFESSSSKTPEFKSFAKIFKNELVKELAKVHAKLTDYSTGHFYVFGFFRLQDGECYYFSLPDVRSWREGNGYFGTLLVRTAKGEKDYTGGQNTRATLEEGMFSKYFAHKRNATLRQIIDESEGRIGIFPGSIGS